MSETGNPQPSEGPRRPGGSAFGPALAGGLVGGALGLILSFGALALIAMQSKQLQVVAHMDWAMLALTFVMALLAALLAGLLPTWRACQVTPALQLKSQ